MEPREHWQKISEWMTQYKKENSEKANADTPKPEKPS